MEKPSNHIYANKSATEKMHKGIITAIIPLSDNRLATASTDCKIIIWKIEEGKAIAIHETTSKHTSKKPPENPGFITSFNLFSNYLVGVTSDSVELQKWNIKESYQRDEESLGGNAIRCLTEVDKDILVMGCDDMTAKVWNFKAGKHLDKILIGHTSSVNCAAIIKFSKFNEEKLLATGARKGEGQIDDDPTIRIWNLQTGECIKTLEGHTAGIVSLISLSDGRLVSASVDKTIKIWDINTEKCIHSIEVEQGIANLALLSNNCLVSAGGNEIILWDLSTYKLIETYKVDNASIQNMVIMPDKSIVIANNFQTAIPNQYFGQLIVYSKALSNELHHHNSMEVSNTNRKKEDYVDEVPAEVIETNTKHEILESLSIPPAVNNLAPYEPFDADLDIPNIPGLKYHEVKGDGHCLFRAVAFYTTTGDYEILRKVVAAHIEKNLEEFRGFITLASGQTIEAYLQAVREGKEWADHVEIEVLMRVLNRPIVIINSHGKILNREKLNRFEGEPIFVHYNGHNHYNVFSLENGYSAKTVLEQLLQPVEQKQLLEQPNLLPPPINPIKIDSEDNKLVNKSSKKSNTRYSEVCNRTIAITEDNWVLSLVRRPQSNLPKHVFIIIEGIEDEKAKIYFMDFVSPSYSLRLGGLTGDGKIRIFENAGNINAKLLFTCDEQLMDIKPGEIIKRSSWSVTKIQALFLLETIKKEVPNPPSYLLPGDGFSPYQISRKSSNTSKSHNCFTWAREKINNLNDDRIHIPNDKEELVLGTMTSEFLSDSNNRSTLFPIIIATGAGAAAIISNKFLDKKCNIM